MNRTAATPRPAGAAVNLDTRRVEFQAVADLTGADDLIDVVHFEGTDAMTGAVRVALISHSAGFVAGADLGWRMGDTLTADVSAGSGDKLTLAVTVESLRRALFERQRTREIAIAFSTTIAFARGVQASAERRVLITPQVRAPAPGVSVRATPVDVNRPDPINGQILGALDISLPGDLALEDAPQVLIELFSPDLPGEALSLAPPPIAAQGLLLTRAREGSDNRLSRWLLGFADPRAVAGHVVSLELAAAPSAVLAAIDRRATATGETPGSAALSLLVAARLTGWAPVVQASMAESPISSSLPPVEGVRRLWRINAPDMVSAIHGADSAAVSVGIAGSSLTWNLDGEPATARTDAIEGGFALDAVRRTLRLPDVHIAIDGWPPARSRHIIIETRLSGTAGAAVSEKLTLSAPPGLIRRSGRLPLPLAQLAPEIVTRIERELGGKSVWHGALEVRLRASSEGQAVPDFTVTVPLVARPQPRRFPIVIDCGASAVGVWVATPREDGQAGTLKRVALAQDGGFLPGVLEHSARTDALPMPALHHVQGLPDFAARAPAPRLASSRRRGAPRMAMTSASLAAQAQGETRRPAELMADAIAGLIVGHVLPAVPALRRPEEVRARLIPRIVLTVPSDVGPEPSALWAAVPSRLAARLEPFFPGIEAMPDAIALLPEPVAAGRHAVARVADAGGAMGQPQHVVSLDIGATATQIGVHAVSTDRALPLAAFGVAVAGDTLHTALLGVFARWVDQAQATLGERFRALHDEGPLGPVAADGSAQELSDPRLATLDLLSEAVAEGQIALAESELRAGVASQAWTGSAEPLRVVLARFGGRLPARGVLLPQGPVEAQEGVVAPHVRWRISPPGTGGQQVLELLASPEAFTQDSPALQRLSATVRFLAVTVPRLAMSAVPAGADRPARVLVPSGRGALWPPLLAALRQEAERFGDAMLAPLTSAEMKHAVGAGAAILCAEGQLLSSAAIEPAYAAPLAIAVQAVRVSASGETNFVVERLFYLAGSVARSGRAYEAENADQPSLSGRVMLGRRFVLARALPGLDPAGRVLAEWRAVTGETAAEPVRALDGDPLADAQSEGLTVFGPCDITAKPMADGAVHVSVRALDSDWSAAWRISGDVAQRLHATDGWEG